MSATSFRSIFEVKGLSPQFLSVRDASGEEKTMSVSELKEKLKFEYEEDIFYEGLIDPI